MCMQCVPGFPFLPCTGREPGYEATTDVIKSAIPTDFNIRNKKKKYSNVVSYIPSTKYQVQLIYKVEKKCNVMKLHYTL